MRVFQWTSCDPPPHRPSLPSHSHRIRAVAIRSVSVSRPLRVVHSLEPLTMILTHSRIYTPNPNNDVYIAPVIQL